MRRFHSLSPKIYPLFPAALGRLRYASLVQHAINTRSDGHFTGKLDVTVTLYCDGEVMERHEHEIVCKDGVAERESISFDSSAPGLGYAEIEIVADQPIFQKLVPEPAYALFAGNDGRCITVNSDMKYANPRVIEQIKTWGKFCQLHSAVYVEPKRKCGESILLINPYDRAIVVGFRGDSDRSIRVRVPSKSARMVNLEPLVEAGVFSTVMLSANNRIVTYDVRHPYGDWAKFNSIDHLDTFSGISTHRSVSLLQNLRELARRTLRRVGFRYT